MEVKTNLRRMLIHKLGCFIIDVGTSENVLEAEKYLRAYQKMRNKYIKIYNSRWGLGGIDKCISEFTLREKLKLNSCPLVL